MRRRSLIAIVAAGMLGAIMVLVVGVILTITRTRWGQDLVRNYAAKFIAPLARGKAPYIGHIDLTSFLSRITVDSIAIYDARGDVFFSCGRFEFGYDWRDLPDSRIVWHTVNIEHPFLHLRQRADESWNFSELFRTSPPSRRPKAAGLSWGDYIVIDSLRAHHATFILSQLWQPDDTLHGTALDSAIAHELTRTDRIIRSTPDGFQRTRTWSDATIFLPYIRLADPDSDKKSGKVAVIGDLHVNESDPPFSFRHTAGRVRLLSDSLWITLSHWDLPASTGTAQGKLVWGSDQPMRYDLHIRADSVALNDVNWVYPALPRTGGGKTLLTIRNERNLRFVDFRLDSMDLRTTNSHLTGTMTFGSGAPVLLVRDVNVVADPVDFDFFRALNEKPFPVDWRGQIYGNARGPGGPVDEFLVDDVQGEWRDTHVPGAVSRFGGHGGLDILDPAVTAFHDFQLTLGSLDLRSIEYLFPGFPRLKGTISGTATLDSSWEDVRLRAADITHRDGPGDESHLTGSGRVTVGTPFMAYDLNLNAQSLSFDLLSRTYPNFPLHGVVSGPIRVVGQIPDLHLTTALSGTPGKMGFDGHLDLDSSSGYTVNGQGELVELDLQKISGNKAPFPGTASGRYDVDLHDLFTSKLGGTAGMTFDRSVFDRSHIDAGTARVAITDGVASFLEPLQATGPGWSLSAMGGIGIRSGGADALHVIFETDSLSPWRPYLASRIPSSVLDSLTASHDSVDVVVSGRLDSLSLRDGQAWSRRVRLGSDSAPRVVTGSVSATFAMENVLEAPHGTVAFWADTVHVGAFDLDTLRATWSLFDSTHSAFTLAARGDSSLSAEAGGTLTSAGATRTWRFSHGILSPDSSSHWQLDSTGAIVVARGTDLDSLVFGFTNGAGGRVSVAGAVPDSAPVSLDVFMHDVGLPQLAEIAEHPLPLVGDADLTAHVRGTRASPSITYAAALTQPAYGDVHMAALTARGSYQHDRLVDTITVSRDSTADAVADLSIPLRLSLPATVQLFPDSAISGHVQGGNIDLHLLQAFFPETKDSGSISVTTQSLSLQGTWRQPRIVGDVAVHGARVQVAALGSVTFDSINAHVQLRDNEIVFDSLRAHSGGAGHGEHAAVLRGSVRMPTTRTGWSELLFPSAFYLTFTATDFAVFNNRLARVDVQTSDGVGASARARTVPVNGVPLPPPGVGIQLVGPLDSATLSDSLTVLNSVLYLGDSKVASKQVIASADSLASKRSMSNDSTWVDRLFKGLRLPNATIKLGENVELKSLADDPTQADVKLTGTLVLGVPVAASALRSGNLAGGSLSDRLALQGTLQAEQGGHYTLDLGVLRRPFTVLSGSTISYDGTVENNPTLDLKAEYDVRQYGRPDISIIADLNGPLRPGPTVSLSSPNAGADVSESDLFSYLLIGGPGFNFGENPSAAAAVAALLGPSFNSFLSSSFGRFGAAFNNLQFVGASADVTKTYDLRNDPIRYITGGRLSKDFQLSSKVYFSVSSGLCTLAGTPQGQDALDQFGQGLGAQFEYRVSPMTRFQAGAEPSTQAQLCSTFTDLPGFAPTPRQYNFALSHIWRW